MNITPHFTFDECKCPCCDRIKIIPGLFKHMELLEEARDEFGLSIIINSGYRCPAHNEEVEGAKKSWHLIFATDLRPEWGEGFKQRLNALYKIIYNQDWGGIGRYSNFIHLDLRPDKARWVE